MTDAAQAPGKFAIFRHRGFTLLILGKLMAIFANQMQMVAVGWQVYNLTNDPLDLGFVGLSQFMPAILLILVTGHVADHYDRRRVVAMSFATQFCSAALFFAFALIGYAEVWPFFVILVLYGAAKAFYSPATTALIPNLVPREEFATAVAWNSSTGKLATITGPAMGGVLYIFGPEAVYATCALMYVGATTMLLMIPQTTQTKSAKEPPSWNSLMAGFRYMKVKPVIFGAISMDLFAVLFSGLPALLPIYARDILDAGPVGLGVLRSSPAIGGLAAGLILTQIPPMRRSGLILFVSVAIFGLATIVFAYSEIFVLSVAALAILGAADMVSVYIRLTLIQIATPDDMRGRVSAVNSVFITASNELGEFRAGVMAAAIGAIGAAAVGGFAVLGVTGLWWRWFPGLRNADRLDGK